MDKLNEVTTHFIGQNSIEGEGFSLKLLILSLTFLSLMIKYYNGLIHIDLVVSVVPDVPYSYDNFAKTVFASRT